MDYNSLKSFVNSLNEELNKGLDNMINDYIIDDFDIPFYLNYTFDYDWLKEAHLRIIECLYQSKNLIDDERIDELVYELFRLKLLTDSLIQNHKKDITYKVGKFEKEHFKSLDYKDINKLSFHSSTQKNKTITLRKLYRLLVQKERVENTKEQRKAFISLFFENKINDLKVNWYKTDVDLKAFLTALVESKIIRFNPSDIIEFAYCNFKDLNRSGDLKTINKTSFKGYQGKPHYENLLDEWKQALSNFI